MCFRSSSLIEALSRIVPDIFRLTYLDYTERNTKFLISTQCVLLCSIVLRAFMHGLSKTGDDMGMGLYVINNSRNVRTSASPQPARRYKSHRDDGGSTALLPISQGRTELPNESQSSVDVRRSNSPSKDSV